MWAAFWAGELPAPCSWAACRLGTCSRAGMSGRTLRASSARTDQASMSKGSFS